MKIDLNNVTLNTIISCLEASKSRNDQAKKLHNVELFTGVDEALTVMKSITKPRVLDIDTGYTFTVNEEQEVEFQSLYEQGFEIVESKEDPRC